jgi:hypothetical protein
VSVEFLGGQLTIPPDVSRDLDVLFV